MTENRIFKSRQKKRIIFTDAERKILAEKAKALGKDLKDTATIIKPETLLKWYRNLIAKKWDYSDRAKNKTGRPPITKEIEKQIVELAKENPDWGYDRIAGAKYLIHDSDSKYTEKFDAIFKSIGCEAVKLPPRSPNLNAYAERWVRSVKDECLSKYILFSQKMLRYVLKEYIEHYHVERNHQGVNNTLLFPNEKIHNSGSITKSSRLGGLLNFYYRKAA